MSVLYIALAQATDCLEISEKLSPTTKAQYEAIRAICPKFIEDQTFYKEIAETENYLRNNISHNID
jgi:histidine ammonia-lyase